MPTDDEPVEETPEYEPIRQAAIPIGVAAAAADEDAVWQAALRLEAEAARLADELRRAAAHRKWETVAEVGAAIARGNIETLMSMYGEVRMCRLCAVPVVFFRARGHRTLVLTADTCREHGDDCAFRDDLE